MPAKRLIAVWSREVDSTRLAGRPKIIMSLREVMSRHYLVQDLRLQNVLEHKHMRTLWETIAVGITSLLSGDIPSCQCLLFCDRQNHLDLARTLADFKPDVLYCDGVRTFYFLRSLGHLRTEMRIVVDFDDLMSRRMEALATSDSGLSLGYLRDSAPSYIRNALASGPVSKTIARYERGALIEVEDQVGRWVDAITMVSSVEGDALRDRLRRNNSKAEVHAILPPVEVIRPVHEYRAFSRFFFIGTDILPQNKLTISLILDLWRTNTPAAEIHIFGNMLTRWPEVKGVRFRGYVESLTDVYNPDSVLFAPGVLRGGLKTKVPEAFSYGCAVVGNDVTFEGIPLVDYPLLAETDEDLLDIVKTPDSYLRAMKVAALQGQEVVRTFMSRERFEQAWMQVLQ
jgi:hypothetical protein